MTRGKTGNWLPRPDTDNDVFSQQHQLRTTGEREVNGARRSVLLNDGESPLGWLKGRKDRNGNPLISEPQYEAGERLRADYWFAHMNPRITSNWSAFAPQDRTRRGAPSNASALRDEVIAAKERVMRALIVVEPEVSGILVDICCDSKGSSRPRERTGGRRGPARSCCKSR
jgi:hypothetical protein